jgi:hypothetical protein
MKKKGAAVEHQPDDEVPHDLVVVHCRVERGGEEAEERGEDRYPAVFDRDPDREEADRAGADHRVGDEPGKRVADPGPVLSAQTHHLARHQQVHRLADDVDREEQHRHPRIEECAGQQCHRQERALSLPGKRKDSVRVVTQILQEPVAITAHSRRDVPVGQGRHVPISSCALIASLIQFGKTSAWPCRWGIVRCVRGPLTTRLVRSLASCGPTVRMPRPTPR